MYIKHKLYISGNLFHDFGLLEFYDLNREATELKTNYISVELPEESVLTNNILVKLEENVKEAEAKKKKQDDKEPLITFPYMRNSPKWGNFGSMPKSTQQKEVERNLKMLVNLSFSELEEEYNSEYQYNSTCTICKTRKAPGIDFLKKTERLISNSLFPLLGSQKSDKSNYQKENIKLCFTCELLGLLSLINYIDAKKGSIFYSRDLKFNHIFNYIIRTQSDLLSEERKISKLINYSKTNIKEFRFNPANRLQLGYQNTYQLEELLRSIKLSRIINSFNFKEGFERRVLIQKLKQRDYNLVKGNMLSSLIALTNREYDQFKTIWNLKKYMKFIENLRGENMTSEIFTPKTTFYSSGSKLCDKFGSGDDSTNKIKRLSLRLIKLLQGNDKKTIVEELMHIMIVHNVKIPKEFSESILNNKNDEDLHLIIGSFIEGLNSKIK